MTHKMIDMIADIFERRGADCYLGETVTMAEHMLQCAALAAADGAPAELVVAALLHDIGYFTEEFGEYSTADTVDHRHEAAGATILAGSFPPLVTECVRLHVAAKRYLCAADPRYSAKLSAASTHSLALQGGPLSATEIAAFEQLEFHREAVKVRLWDDAAKQKGARTPSFRDFQPLVQSVIIMD